jgi:rod shape-determining protein MreD
MALFVLWCLILLATALPGCCPRFLGLANHAPDVWLAVVAYLALRGRGFSAVGWAILLGLVRDSLSLDPLGTHAFVLGAVAWLFCEGRASRGRVEGLPRVLFTALAALVAGWLYLLRVLPIGGPPVTLGDFVQVVPRAFWTACLAAGLHPLLDGVGALDDLIGRRHGLPA